MRNETNISRAFMRLPAVLALAAMLIAGAVHGGSLFHHRRFDDVDAKLGLFDWLLPQFTEATGIEVQVVAVGTGQAIRIATNGDADVLLVASRGVRAQVRGRRPGSRAPSGHAQ